MMMMSMVVYIHSANLQPKLVFANKLYRNPSISIIIHLNIAYS